MRRSPSIFSASSFISLLFSDPSSFRRLASFTSIPAYLVSQLLSVPLKIPMRRQISSTWVPASCNLMVLMIYSSVQRFSYRDLNLTHFNGNLTDVMVLFIEERSKIYKVGTKA